jgi:RNA polymerase sigma factor (sigma-70 family)
MHGRRHGRYEPEPVEGPSDRELLDRVRAGDTEAFDPLYRRHAYSALLHARHFTRTEASAQDLRAESFTRVLAAIRGGNGPTEAVRPYLLTTMRHVAQDWAEGERRTLLVADPADLEAPAEGADPVIAALERSLAGQAFAALPERWQTVLWHTEVEGEGPAQLAPMLGLEPPAVAALAYRAREGLKQAYLQAHIRELGSEACRPYAGRLGVLVRGRLGTREDAKVNRHLRDCAECSALLAMLKYINSHLGVLIGPAVLGTAFAAKFIAAAAGAAAGGTGGAAHSGGMVARSLSKARHASPRQQAAAALTVAAVVIAATAFALTSSQTAAPATAPSPKRQLPSAEPPSVAPVSAVAPASSAPPPASAPPAAVPPPKQPPPATSASPSRPPASSTPSPPPSSPSQSPSASPSPPPSASPEQEICPGIVIGIDLTIPELVQIEIELGIILPGEPPILDCDALPTEF